VMQR